MKSIAVGMSGAHEPKQNLVRGKGRVAVGLSGGVDSSLSAALLVEQGYEVTGVFLECWRGPGCRAEEDRKDALDVALSLGVPFEVLDFKETYKRKVVDYFYEEYEAGRTPNPDVMCNKEIKFGLFYDWALRQAQGKLPRFDYIATGHYARTDGKRLYRGKDAKKDQSYFLYQLKAEQLAHVLFPLGEMTKAEVRKLAKKKGLLTADKPDSQGICFIGEVRVDDFLKDLGMKEQEGEVYDLAGEVIGTHKGAWFYTVGQRHGFQVQKSKLKAQNLNYDIEAMPPLYVVQKDVANNVLVVAQKQALYTKTLAVEKVHVIDAGFKIQDARDLRVRIRNLGELVKVKQVSLAQQVIRVELESAVFGAAPGQAAVFYRQDECVGGGVIV